jgi:hypothetical protein
MLAPEKTNALNMDRCSRCMENKELIYFLGKHIKFCDECKKILGIQDPEYKSVVLRSKKGTAIRVMKKDV